MKENKHSLKIKDLTQVGPMSFVQVSIPDSDPKLGDQAIVYLRWEPTKGELNIEVSDMNEPLKGGMSLISYTKSDIVIKLRGME